MTNRTKIGALWRKHLRLTLLRLLGEMPGHQANSSLLFSGAADLGFGGTFDQVETELGWLADQGLATLANKGAVKVAAATRAGLDVAAGRREHDGVQAPSPEEG